MDELQTDSFYQKNKPIILLSLFWMFRMFFLNQGNAGGVAINKFVLVQIFAELGIFFTLIARGFNFTNIFKTPIMWWSILYLLGMISIFWSPMPLVSCYFAFQNIIILVTLYYLATQTKDIYQLERFFIYACFFDLALYYFRAIVLWGGHLHSVSHSTVAGLLLVYCIAEYSKSNRPAENIKALKWGIGVGLITLILTSSSGAMVSVTVALFCLAFFAKHPMFKACAFLGVLALLISYFAGLTDWLLPIIFPNESIETIQSANGRSVIWEMIIEKAQMRPWFGWGYASVERLLETYCSDAHNAIIGTLGSQGYIGVTILILAMGSLFFYVLNHRNLMGFRGLLAATICGLVNSNTSNFLVSKAGLAGTYFKMIIILAVAYYIMQTTEAITPEKKNVDNAN